MDRVYKDGLERDLMEILNTCYDIMNFLDKGITCYSG